MLTALFLSAHAAEDARGQLRGARVETNATRGGKGPRLCSRALARAARARLRLSCSVIGGGDAIEKSARGITILEVKIDLVSGSTNLLAEAKPRVAAAERERECGPRYWVPKPGELGARSVCVTCWVRVVCTEGGERAATSPESCPEEDAHVRDRAG